MRIDNYISFAVVNGFFFGLILSLIKYDDAVMLVVWTIMTTAGFYIFTLFCSSLFVAFFEGKTSWRKLNKGDYESALEYLNTEFLERERISSQVRHYARSSESEDLDSIPSRAK